MRKDVLAIKDASATKALRSIEAQTRRSDTRKLIQMVAQLVRSGTWGLWLDGKMNQKNFLEEYTGDTFLSGTDL